MDGPKTSPASPQTSSSAEDRRGFVAKAAAIVIGAIIILFPFAAGLGPFFDPLRRRNDNQDSLTPLAKLSDLPEDGTPRRFQVITDRDDAWSRQPRQPVGAVYLRRLEGDKVQAFTATCPHAGCFVDYRQDSKQYLCPCHQSPFTLDGGVIQPSPSPRDMDSLEVEVRKDGEGDEIVFVKFQQFYTGRAEKEPKV